MTCRVPCLLVIEFQQAGDPVAIAVDLANTWDTLESQHEQLREVADLRAFLERHEYSGAAAADERDLARVREFRDELRAVFAEPDDDRAAMRLNGLLERSGAVPQLVPDGEEWALRHTPVGSGPSARLIAAASAAVAEAVSALGWERLGTCEAAPCTCVFVDRSRSGTRRYCCRLCADRAATAAYRERRRGDSG